MNVREAYGLLTLFWGAALVSTHLTGKINMIQEFIDEEPEIKITYFEPDKKKSGGAYITITGTPKRVDEYEQLLIMTDGMKIKFDCIYRLESDLFWALGMEE